MSLHSLTVAELRELLEGQDDDAMVIFSADYGDIGHTQQALPLRGRISEVQVTENRGYSQSGYEVVSDVDEDDDFAPEPDEQTYLLIK